MKLNTYPVVCKLGVNNSIPIGETEVEIVKLFENSYCR